MFVCIDPEINETYVYCDYILVLFHSFINTLRPRQDGRHFGRRHFQIQISQWKCYNIDKNSLNFVPKGPIDNKSSLLGNSLAPNKRQAITWTNDDPVQWPIYSSPGLNELTDNYIAL